MRTIVLFSLLSAAALFAFGQATHMQSWMDRGKREYRLSHFVEAATNFQKAVTENPSDVNARLFLASAHTLQYTPGEESEENRRQLSKARAEYKAVLQLDPANQQALSALATLSFYETYSLLDEAARAEKLDEARDFARRLAGAHPSMKEGHYLVGAFAEQKWNLADPKARGELGGTLDEGIGAMRRALEIDSADTDAMRYLSMMLRQRADLRNTAAEHEQEIAEADRWEKQAADLERKRRPTSLTSATVLHEQDNSISFDVNPQALHQAETLILPFSLPPPPPPLRPPPPPPSR